MKVFFKKLRRTSLSVRLIYYFVFLLFLVSYIFIVRSLLSLTSIETTIRIIVIIVLGTLLLFYWFLNLLFLLTKHNKTVIVTSVIAMLISCISIVGGLYINKAMKLISNITEDETTVYTTDLVLLKNTEFQNSSGFEVGIIDNESDVEGNI